MVVRVSRLRAFGPTTIGLNIQDAHVPPKAQPRHGVVDEGRGALILGIDEVLLRVDEVERHSTAELGEEQLFLERRLAGEGDALLRDVEADPLLIERAPFRRKSRGGRDRGPDPARVSRGPPG